MEPNEKLLLQNKAWSEEKVEQDKDFFNRLAHQQAPKFLWIGCSDSRVPANEITGTDPGEMFVHRNIANMVVHNDLNMLSVLQYAVDVLKVEHIIVCGHYGCGGVKAALTKNNFGLINKWLQNIKEVYHANKSELDSIADPEEKSNVMVERNVITQCHELVKTSIIQKSWHQRNYPKIHGWVYGLKDGLLKELLTIEANPNNVPEAFRFDESEL